MQLSSTLLTGPGRICPRRMPGLAWAEEEEDGVLREGLEVFAVVHLKVKEVKFIPSKFGLKTV